MRLIYLGFQTWGWESLNALLRAGYDIPLVLTHPASDHPYERIWNRSVADLARTHGIDVVECWRITDAGLRARISALQADYFFASDWRTILPPEVLALTRRGGVNVHDALLPRYGGFAPINWAIANGDTSIGLTAHMISDEVDLGDIVAQREIPVGPHDTATDAVQEVFRQLGPFSVQAMQRLAQPGFVPSPQDRSAASFFPKRRPDDVRIHWDRAPGDIYNLIRAQSAPYPAATMRHRDQEVGVRQACLTDALCQTAGRMHLCDQRGPMVTCGNVSAGFAALQIQTLETTTGQILPATNFLTQSEEACE